MLSPTTTPQSEMIAYRPAFGIDYRHPEVYLTQGEQSAIPDPEQLDELRAEEQGLAQLEDIYRWLESEFETYAAGGSTIGLVTVGQLLADRRLGGCHDTALVYASVARELGYPSVIADSASIPWIERHQALEVSQPVGHAFVEVYLMDKWVLVDPSNGWYVENGYDPANPVIPLTIGPRSSHVDVYGCYVMRKGRDTWDTGIYSLADLKEAMETLADGLDLQTIEYPVYTILRFAPPAK